MTTDTAIKPLPWQARALAIPESLDVALVSGRGPGKTFCLLLLALRFCATYGDKARCLIVRRTYAALLDLEDQLIGVASQAFGTAAVYNRGDRILHVPGGGRIELSQLEERKHYDRFQGRQFGLVAVDEATQWADPRLLDLLRSNLRAPEGVPTRYVLSANPGSAGHQWVARRHVSGVIPWRPYTEPVSGREFVSCTASFRENVHLDRDQYERQLIAATGHDTGLQAAWLEGDWNAVLAGSFFGDLEPDIYTVDGRVWSPKFFERERRKRTISVIYANDHPEWKWRVAIDHGSAAPCVALLLAEAPAHDTPTPDGRYLRAGTAVVVDEMALHDPSDLNRGLQYVIPEIVDEIRALVDPWKVRPSYILDGACFSNRGMAAGTEAEEYRQAGLPVTKSEKPPRPASLLKLKRLLGDASKVDVPVVMISTRCSYLLETLQTVTRDEKKPDDLAKGAPDHAIDALRYGLQSRGQALTVYSWSEFGIM